MSMPVETPAVDVAPPGALSALLGLTLDAVAAARGDMLSVKDAASGRYLHLNAAMA